VTGPDPEGNREREQGDQPPSKIADEEPREAILDRDNFHIG
jgi:hypothetical protein